MNSFETIGHYKIRGKYKSQKNWMIYAFVDNKGGNLLVEDYKNKGDLLFAFDKPIGYNTMGNFTIFGGLNRMQFEDVLYQIERFFRGKYKSLKWFINQNKVDKIKTILRLTE